MSRAEFHETVIPAGPGWSLIYIETDADPKDDDDPRMSSPVIAWSIVSVARRMREGDDAETGVAQVVPITTDGPPLAQPHVLSRPDGLFETLGNGVHSTLAEATTEARRIARFDTKSTPGRRLGGNVPERLELDELDRCDRCDREPCRCPSLEDAPYGSLAGEPGYVP